MEEKPLGGLGIRRVKIISHDCSPILSLFFLIFCVIEMGDLVGFEISSEAVVICCFSALQTAVGFQLSWCHQEKISARVGFSTCIFYTRISARVGASTHLYVKNSHKSQRDLNPFGRVNPGLKKG